MDQDVTMSGTVVSSVTTDAVSVQHKDVTDDLHLHPAQNHLQHPVSLSDGSVICVTLCLAVKLTTTVYPQQGAPWSWKVIKLRGTIFQAWKLGKSWKIAKIMESHGK